MVSQPEKTTVEQPLIDQLERLGWSTRTGNPHEASATGRESFRDVLLEKEIKDALCRINLRDGQRWLDEGRLSQAISALRRLQPGKLLEKNQCATELLLKGTVVDGVEGWNKGRGQTIQYIDWNDIKNNHFLAMDQFRVECPPGQSQKFLTPDVVLFVNGIPLVVIECKSPAADSPIESAIDQLQRYANQREHINEPEGNEALFYTNQFVIATSYDQARVGTFTSKAAHFLAWKDTYPTPKEEVALLLRRTLSSDGKGLSEQEILVSGMLKPSHLLDIVRHFTLFQTNGGKTFKIVCRYQQFRAVQRAIKRLLEGKTLQEDSEQDRRGGLIWHTQGSGKSLTMVFLIRKMRSDERLRCFKIVVVTDRIDLQQQLSETAQLTDEPLTVIKARREGNKSISALEEMRRVLSREGRDLVFAMIQAYRGESKSSGIRDLGAVTEDDEEFVERGEVLDFSEKADEQEGNTPSLTLVAPPKSSSSKSGQKQAAPKGFQTLPVLNEDENILVIVDEAHRSHTNTAHANMMNSLPNCAKIGFTGTPIIMGAKKKTAQIFGEYIDRYTLKESEEDGSTVKILYEGRTSEGEVAEGETLDTVFESMLGVYSAEQIEKIKAKYATKGNIAESEQMIAAKSRDMLRHYVENILPNGLKAQIVAVSRRAAIRYIAGLRQAQTELVSQLQGLGAKPLTLSSEQQERLDKEQGFLVRAHPFLDRIKILEFAAVISGSHNDEPSWKEWTDRTKIATHIARFKKAMPQDPTKYESQKEDPLAFLVVKSMLLTGFDAPNEQVMYLDRHIQEAELLQAIARVNRTYNTNTYKKEAGLVVDYYGVAHHLQNALQAYSGEDVAGALQSLKDELPKLRDRHLRALDVFQTQKLSIKDQHACVEALEDPQLRCLLRTRLKEFFETLDLVLPRPEGLPYLQDAKTLAFIQARAHNKYRAAGPLIGQEIGAKVRALLDAHIQATDPLLLVPPIEITHPDFEKHVRQQKSPRAQASEMEHTLRYHIRIHLDEDPAYYETLSEKLERLFAEMRGDWELVASSLQKLLGETLRGRGVEELPQGITPTDAPFYFRLKQKVYGTSTLSEKQIECLAKLTAALVKKIKEEIALVEFWNNTHAQETLRKEIVVKLDDEGLVPLGELEELADLLMELAKTNDAKLRRT